ncbi:MAG: hypothetical protein ABSB49_13260 [Polyangia bacterium]
MCKRACSTGAAGLRLTFAHALLVAVAACSSHGGNSDILSPDAGIGASPDAESLDAAIPTVALSVGADSSLVYPSGLATLPDEHTSFLPTGSSTTDFLVFAASGTPSSGAGVTGALVLQTTDLVNFTLASGFGVASLGNLVLDAPSAFTDCSFTGAGSFDQNYAAPGSVVHDPTLPSGNLVMLYEAEQHCFGGQYDFNFFASVGLARSSDGGKTWPRPGAADRYAVLQVPGPKPSATPAPAEGDAIPSAFVDDIAPGSFLYVVYQSSGAATIQPDGYLRVARAQLGQSSQLALSKWYQGGFSQPGIGGLDSPITAQRGCGTSGYQSGGQISYVDPLQRYLLTFVCVKLQLTTSGKYEPYEAGWYFSTATSLESQDWSAPALIAGSTGSVAAAPTPGCPNGADFDGWYPSFVTPGSEPGHLGSGGFVFFLDGCDGGSTGRVFSTRTFTFQ